MGLLDFLNDDSSQLALGLLAAAGPSATPASFGQRLYGAMQGHQQYLANKEDRAERKEDRKLRTELTQLQMKQLYEAQRKAAEQEERQKKQQEFLAQQFSPIRPIEANAASGVTGPRPEALGAVGAKRPVDYQQMLALGISPDLVKTLAEAQNFGRAKVARTIDSVGPDGMPVTRQFDEYGAPVGGDVRKPVETRMVDLGGSQVGIDPYSGQKRFGFDKSMTPDGIASNQVALGNLGVARGNLGIAQQRLALDAQNAAAGKAPQGYRFKPDGALEAIPGGPADIKAGEAGQRADQKKAATISQSNSVLDTISEAKNLTGFNTAGFGSVLTRVPATDARNLQAKLETIKANLGFDRLQQMRDSSPTGGALGAVAVQELTALQSTVASLDQMQSPAELNKALNKIEGHYERWLEVMGAPRKRTGLDPKAITAEADRIIGLTPGR